MGVTPVSANVPIFLTNFPLQPCCDNDSKAQAGTNSDKSEVQKGK
jgi:hypothetical protein